MRLNIIICTLFLSTGTSAAAASERLYPQLQVIAFLPDGSFDESHFLRSHADSIRSSNETEPGLHARDDQCSSSEIPCKGGCIYKSATCCPKYDTEFYANRGCFHGETCTRNGCCSQGQNCSNIGNCVAPQQVCNSGCMPAGAHCCDNDQYCLKGTHCSNGEYCAQGAAGRIGVPALLGLVALVAASTL